MQDDGGAEEGARPRELHRARHEQGPQYGADPVGEQHRGTRRDHLLGLQMIVDVSEAQRIRRQRQAAVGSHGHEEYRRRVTEPQRDDGGDGRRDRDRDQLRTA